MYILLPQYFTQKIAYDTHYSVSCFSPFCIPWKSCNNSVIYSTVQSSLDIYLRYYKYFAIIRNTPSNMQIWINSWKCWLGKRICAFIILMAISKSLTFKMSGNFHFLIFILGEMKGSWDSVTRQFSGGMYNAKMYKVVLPLSFRHVLPRV